jgi:hypothetical protein
MSERRWFRRRRIGVGWQPASWQGWLITLVMLVAVLGVLTRMHHSGARLPIVIAIVGVYAIVGLGTGGARRDQDASRR